MADVWHGKIILPDGNEIDAVSLASNDAASSFHLPSNTFRFLSVVDTARIPLYLAAGPSLDVWTTFESTQEWFQSILLDKTTTAENEIDDACSAEWWKLARSQAPIGILVEVDRDPAPSPSPRVTEILFYGTISPNPRALLPTPPNSTSSSPELQHVNEEGLLELRVHALPLSADLLVHSQIPEIPPLSPLDETVPTEFESQFLSSPYSVSASRPESPKRKRDVFEEAAQARKRAKGKGGESVSAAAAKMDTARPGNLHRKSLSIDARGIPSPGLSRPNTADPAAVSRSQSPATLQDVRPFSRKGIDVSGKRSSLSHVESVPLAPEEPTTESRNKEALSRVVMAAMRMYGLQQRKKSHRSRRGSVAAGRAHDLNDKAIEEEVSAEEVAKDEEYKLIYHQTFKGAALALRNHIKTEPLHSRPDCLRDTVEKLLAIFCNDPITEPLPAEETTVFLETPNPPKISALQASPFDIASSTLKAPVIRQMPVVSPTPKGKA